MLTYLTASGSSGSLAAAVMASSGAVVDVFVPASAMTDLLLGRELINALRGAQDVLHVSKFVALCERLMHIGRAAAECMHDSPKAARRAWESRQVHVERGSAQSKQRPGLQGTRTGC